MFKHHFKKILLLFVLIGLSGQANAQSQDFNNWLIGMRKEAARQGVSQRTINAALYNIQPKQRVIELDR